MLKKIDAAFLFFLMMGFIVVLAIVFLLWEPPTESVSGSASGELTLIIDPGHGGADGGAVSLTGAKESEINLDISLRLKALCDLTGTDSLMTRSSEQLDYPPEATSIAKMKAADQKQRAELISSTSNAVLISIHQNKYSTSQPRGPQAFYGTETNSCILADLAQERLILALYPESRRVAAPVPQGLYLFKAVNCPTLLAECGFLSNPEEAALLETEGHQIKTALALMSSFLVYASDK